MIIPAASLPVARSRYDLERQAAHQKPYSTVHGAANSTM
jgi:hypothetical protein